MAIEKKNIHKVEMLEEKYNIIQMLLQKYISNLLGMTYNIFFRTFRKYSIICLQNQ